MIIGQIKQTIIKGDTFSLTIELEGYEYLNDVSISFVVNELNINKTFTNLSGNIYTMTMGSLETSAIEEGVYLYDIKVSGNVENVESIKTEVHNAQLFVRG